jgi:hypothetical protein
MMNNFADDMSELPITANTGGFYRIDPDVPVYTFERKLGIANTFACGSCRGSGGNFGRWRRFRRPCSHVRGQASEQRGGVSSMRRSRQQMAKRLAGDEALRRRLSKLSCAGWLPHDRRFVSGLPRSKRERRSATVS